MLDDISTFISIVEAGSFVRAAQQLQISQATVSRRLRALEDKLGISLIVRSTQGFELSRAGARLYSEFKAQQNALAKTIDELRIEEQLVTGHLRISLPTAMAYTMISPYIADFMNQNPSIDLEIYYQNCKIDIIREKFDMAIVNYRPQQQSVLVRKIYTASLGIYCSPKYIEMYGEPLSMEELDENRLCVGNFNYNVIKSVEQNHNYDPHQLMFIQRGRLLTNNSLHNKQIALSGHAIVGGWDDLYAEELATGKLIRILQDYSLGDLPFYLIRTDTHKNAALTAFIKFVDECFAKAKQTI